MAICFFGRSEIKEVSDSFDKWLVQMVICFFGRSETKEVTDSFNEWLVQISVYFLAEVNQRKLLTASMNG